MPIPLPYLYRVVREGTQNGLPIMRALWLHHSDDPAAVARGDEYLWGRDILVAPVVEAGATSRKLYLPRGTWYDWWTNETQQGGREITRNVDLSITPLYVRPVPSSRPGQSSNTPKRWWTRR